MRVLFLAHSYPRRPGDAAGSFLLRLAVGLQAVGVEVRVVAPSAPGLAASDAIEGVDVVRYRYAPRRYETLAYTGSMAADVAASLGGKLALGGLLAAGTRRGIAEAREWKADVIHAHWWFPGGLAGVVASRAAGIPLVTTMHGSDVRLAVGTRAAHPAFRAVLARSAAATAVSSWLAREAARVAPDASVEVAPMPVRAELFAPDPGTRASHPTFLFVGRLNEQKGIANLVRALARVRGDAVLEVVGEGPDAGALRALAIESGVAARIRWLSPVTQQDLPALYRRATALVLPSREEGLGLVAVEAHLCGTPVIGSDSGGIPDVVEHGRTGLLVPPSNPVALAAAMNALLDLPDRGAAMGEQGRRTALDRFTPAAVAARYRRIYESALARHADAAARRR